MREFFKGWRRKVGCGLLVMACVIFGAWMRSGSVEDTFFINMSETQSHVVWLADSGLWWVSSKRFRDEPRDDRFLRWENRPANWRVTNSVQQFGFAKPYSHYDPSFQEVEVEIHWRLRFCGGDFGNITRHGGGLYGRLSPQKVCFVPFWWLMLAPALLSAYLILWKPRPKERRDA